jgi:molybdopterin converting factor subunit 1
MAFDMATEKGFTVLLFATLRDAAGADCITVHLHGDAVTVAQLSCGVEEQYPALALWMPHVRIAVNCSYAELDLLIHENDEIALIPPVAGG